MSPNASSAVVFEEMADGRLRVCTGRFAGYFLGASGLNGYICAYRRASPTFFRGVTDDEMCLFLDKLPVSSYKDNVYASARWRTTSILFTKVFNGVVPASPAGALNLHRTRFFLTSDNHATYWGFDANKYFQPVDEVSATIFREDPGTGQIMFDAPGCPSFLGLWFQRVCAVKKPERKIEFGDNDSIYIDGYPISRDGRRNHGQYVFCRDGNESSKPVRFQRRLLVDPPPPP